MNQLVAGRRTRGSTKAVGAGTRERVRTDADSNASTIKALRAVDWDFSDARTDCFAHGLHPYPAKFIPQIPRKLIELLSQSGDLVWDPFGGSGTTALEALLLGRRALSTDINPVAEVVGRAKTTTLVPEVEIELTQFASELKMLATSGQVDRSLPARKALSAFIPDIPNIDKWFEDVAVRELAYLRMRIGELTNPQAGIIATAAFSKQILNASNQDGETRYAAVPKSLKSGDVLLGFSKQLVAALGKLDDQSRHLQFRTADFRTMDLRHGIQPGDGITPESVDLVVTSPPYPNATDYHLYHRFRIFWLGHDPRQMATAEIGSHLRHQKQGTAFSNYVDEMTVAIRNIAYALKPGGIAVLVVGDAVFKGETFSTSRCLGAAAESIGLELLGEIDRALPTTKRSFISAARRLRTEQLVVLRKPHSTGRVVLSPPVYRLQPYEEQFRKLEIERTLGEPVSEGHDLAVESDSSRLRQARRLAFSSTYRFNGSAECKTWQAILENGDALAERITRKKDPKYVTHGIHPYKGKFYPQLAKALMNLSGAEPRSTVLDPFCGSGTVLLEASLSGLDSIGFDVNPVAVSTALAKTAAVHADAVYRDHLLCSFERKMQEFADGKRMSAAPAFTGGTLEEVLSWFPAPVVPMLSQTLHEIELIPDDATKLLLRVLLSSVIRDVSQQDPRDLRIRRRAEPLVSAPLFELMTARSRALRGRLRHFARVSNSAPSAFGRASVSLIDSASTEATTVVSRGSIDTVITSPPYATALPYIDTDRLSLLVCHGLDSQSRRSIESQLVGSREIRNSERKLLDGRIADRDFDIGSPLASKLVEKIYRLNRDADVGFRRKNTAALLLLYFEKMMRTTRNITPLVKRGSSAFVVIGDTRTTAGDKDIAIRSGAVIQEQFHACGWTTKAVFPITVTRENVVHSKNTITDNEIYWLTKD